MEINHDPKNKIFAIKLDKKEVALSYVLKNNIMEILDVEVPVELRGRGLGEEITLYVFNYAKGKNYKIIPTCPYVKNKFLKDHNEFNDLLD